jgi:hypothetical protein
MHENLAQEIARDVERRPIVESTRKLHGISDQPALGWLSAIGLSADASGPRAQRPVAYA